MRVETQTGLNEYPSPVHSEPVREGMQQHGDIASENKSKIELADLPISRGKIDAEMLQAAADTVNRAFKISNYHLEFKLHEKSGRYQVKVVDTDSQEVVREIPPEHMLDMAANIRQMMDKVLGLLVDELG